MEDKRRCPRWNIDNRAKIQLEGAEAAMDCMIHDINFKGARFSLSQRLPPDTSLKLTVALSPEFSFKAEVWISWHRKIDGHNMYGIYFVKLQDADKDKIYRFIHRYRPQEMSKRWWDNFEEREGGETMEDRRIFERLKANLAVKYLDAQSGQEGQAQAVDISAKGMGLVSTTELKPRAPLEIWIKVEKRDEPLYTRGEVVWSKGVSPTEHRAGISLERADLLGLSRAMRAG